MSIAERLDLFFLQFCCVLFRYFSIGVAEEVTKVATLQDKGGVLAGWMEQYRIFNFTSLNLSLEEWPGHCHV